MINGKKLYNGARTAFFESWNGRAELADKVNKLLADQSVEVIDIQYQTSGAGSSTLRSCMVVFRDKQA